MSHTRRRHRRTRSREFEEISRKEIRKLMWYMQWNTLHSAFACCSTPGGGGFVAVVNKSEQRTSRCIWACEKGKLRKCGHVWKRLIYHSFILGCRVEKHIIHNMIRGTQFEGAGSVLYNLNTFSLDVSNISAANLISSGNSWIQLEAPQVHKLWSRWRWWVQRERSWLR